MKLDEKQFWETYNVMTAIGKTAEGGCERLSMSEEDIAARKKLISMLEAEGLSPQEDETGAIWARLEGSDPQAAPVLVGSHIDTVRNGGKYDGLLGVMLGFQAMRQIKESGEQHKRAIELVVFPTEESARFNYPTVGSKLLSGKLEADKLKEMKDSEGISLYEALEARGFNPSMPQNGRARLKRAFSMVELHIEQGPLLESSRTPIGIVSAIAAPTRLSVIFEGEYAHSGACPMHLRHDALAAAAEFILIVEKIGNIEANDKSVAAVTLCELKNPSMNVVPGRVELTVDIRGIDQSSIARCVAGVDRQLKAICRKRGVAGRYEVLSSDQPILMSERMILAIIKACDKCHIRYEIMPSGAGHDAMNVAAVIPTGMIFIPCKGGISHNPLEEVEKEDVEAGFGVLAQTIINEANHK